MQRLRGFDWSNDGEMIAAKAENLVTDVLKLIIHEGVFPEKLSTFIKPFHW